MALYLDTEFNGFGGELISLALVSSKTGKRFYGVFPLPDVIHPWVQEHVIPFLVKEPEDADCIIDGLVAFLQEHDDEIIYADWPEDFVHLMRCLCAEGGFMYPVFPVMQLLNSKGVEPETPHYAPSDAEALMFWHIVNQFEGEV